MSDEEIEATDASEIRAEKIAQIVKTLIVFDKEHEDVVVRCFRGLVIYARGQKATVNLHVWTERDVIRWYDTAAREMIRMGKPFDRAVAATWPACRLEMDENTTEEGGE